MDAQQLNILLTKFAISPTDIKQIAEAGESILPVLPDVISKYKIWANDNPELRDVFPTQQAVDENAALKTRHWTSVWTANIDADYVAFRQNMGKIHADLGINLNQYFAILTSFINQYEQIFINKNLATFLLSNAFAKIINLDISLVLDAYNRHHEKALREQSYAIIDSISTPIAQLWDNILFLPLVGIVDSARSKDIMSEMLSKVSVSQARIFILDISGVTVVDTAVANHFIKITKATRLMGCETIISGISPAIAQTIVELGIAIDEITTTSSMKDAIQLAFRKTNILLSQLQTH
jgi:rsbT co-antagonist protein RsbR